MADELRKSFRNIRLIAQDHQYREGTETFLVQNGFEIIRRFGAEAFAEVDDESIVISAYPGVPIRQIIADIAHPVMFITTFSDHRSTLGHRENPFWDTESPRTQQMQNLYEKQHFPAFGHNATPETQQCNVESKTNEVF
ncbi:unnamed protein product [Clonostachys rosea]|uniref:SRR1-like domain-containing protein n=1 Tax=Bionectria ochroleuca TaxID=29856 RepID=A0ABY6TV51_BIOOC|nr:unnamed protein product [Clonostachys rosea]